MLSEGGRNTPARNCHVESGRMPESKHPCAARCAAQPQGFQHGRKIGRARESSPGQKSWYLLGRGPSTPAYDSRANRKAALRMTVGGGDSRRG